MAKPESTQGRNIVVIGAGFAGTTLVRELESLLPAGWRCILISEENYLTYSPLLPEVAGASLLPGHAVAPVRKMIKTAQYRRARVTGIDLQRRRVHCRDRSEHQVPFDQLVLACGQASNLELGPGMAEHALPLKTLGDALYIRNRLIVRLEQAELEDDAGLRRRLMTFLVIGGGSSGVELAGAIADFLDAAKKYYPRARREPAQVIMLESGDVLLDEFPERLGEAALRSLRKCRVEVRLGQRVAEVMEDGVRTESGERIAANNVICTIGTAPGALVRELDVPRRKGRIAVEADMSVSGRPGVWAAGDCASVVNAETGRPSPPTAQFAVRQAKQLARNIRRAIDGEPTRPFSYRSPGQLATIGHRRAVAELFGLKFSGFPAWLLWRAVYLMMLPTFLRKLQVFSEWTLDLLFPRDVTQLHLERSGGPDRDAGYPAQSRLRDVVNR